MDKVDSTPKHAVRSLLRLRSLRSLAHCVRYAYVSPMGDLRRPNGLLAPATPALAHLVSWGFDN